jgi:AraC-like DNA-binding protein
MAIDYIYKNYNQKITLTELSGVVLYDKYALCREFKKYIGINLLQYVTDLKFSYAQALLLNKEASISSVADKLNYSSTTNFINAFKKRFGVPPERWRKNQTST